MSDESEPHPALTGSVAGGVIEHARKCVDFWRSMMSGADRIDMGAPSLEIGGVADLVDHLLAEIARLKAAATAVYRHRWICNDLQPGEQAALWEAMRDAIGLPPGTATSMGVGSVGNSLETAPALTVMEREALEYWIEDRPNDRHADTVRGLLRRHARGER